MKIFILILPFFTITQAAFDPKLLKNELKAVKNTYSIDLTDKEVTSSKKEVKKVSVEPIESLYFDTVKTKLAAPKKLKKRSR